MSTFGRYTGNLTAPHGPWDQAFRANMRGLGGFGRFGDAPDPAAVRCWDGDATRWSEANSYSARDASDSANTLRVRWQGTLICPKPDPWGRHVLYDIYSTHTNDSVVRDPAGPQNPLRVYLVRTGFADAANKVGIFEGAGYFDDGGDVITPRWISNLRGGPGSPEWSGGYNVYDADAAGFTRTHTPQGIAHKGIGAGAVLYAGLAMAAIDAGFKGNYSIEGTRSISASALWKSGRNPRAGPLVTRAQAAIKRSADGSVLPANISMGYGDHCEDAAIQSVPGFGGCSGPTRLECATSRFTRDTYINFDYIDAEGLRRWGLVVFNVPKIKGEGLIAAKREPTDKLPYMVRSAWKNDDVKTAFGMKVSPSSLTSQSTALQKYSRSLSDAGLELLSRAAIGPSTALIVKVAAVLQGRNPDRAVAFLRREDIATVLAKTGAGKAILASQGLGTPLSGLGRGAFRDIETAAAAAAASPLALTLPDLSRSTQSFVNNYPDEG